MSKESAAPSVCTIESSSSTSAEVELALSVFKELSIAGPFSIESKLEKKSSDIDRKSRQRENFSLLMNTCERNRSRQSDALSQRFSPYNVSMVTRRTKSAQPTKRRRIDREDSDIISFNTIKLEGCDFQESLPSVSYNEKKFTSGDGKPCWLQYRDEQQNQFQFNDTSEASPALQSESDLEVDELSEYFHAFVTVKMKMSSQAESMYA